MIEALVAALLGLLDITRNLNSEQTLKSKAAKSLMRIYLDLNNIIESGRNILDYWESSREKLVYILGEEDRRDSYAMTRLLRSHAPTEYLPVEFLNLIDSQIATMKSLEQYLNTEFSGNEIDIYIKDFTGIVKSFSKRKKAQLTHLNYFLYLSERNNRKPAFASNPDFYLSNEYLLDAHNSLNQLEEAKNKLREFIRTEFKLTDLIQ